MMEKHCYGEALLRKGIITDRHNYGNRVLRKRHYYAMILICEGIIMPKHYAKALLCQSIIMPKHYYTKALLYQITIM
jgi:hypothetical protein